METFKIYQKKNKLFFTIFTLFIIVHIILSFILHFFESESSIYYALIYLILLTTLFFWNSERPIIQYILLACLNVYILTINIHSHTVVMTIFFIYPIYISILYNSILPRIILFFITLAEIYGLIYFYKASYEYVFTLNDFISFIVLLTMLVSTSILNTLFDNKYWTRLSDQNKTMRKKLHSRESYLQLFFDNAKDSIAVLDKENKIIEVNPAFEELYGWKREEIIGKNIPLVSPPNKLDAEARQKEVLNGASYHFLETEDMKKDGSYFDAQITLSPIYDYDGDLVALSVISRDISFKKEAENLLLQSEKLKIAGEMAAGVAHEIRNPMTVISGFIQIMNSEPTHPYYKYSKVIEKEIDRIDHIINEFLVLAKPHAKVSRVYNLTKTLEDIFMLFQPELNLNGIVLTKQVSTEIVNLFGEESQMKQVLINIIKNAIEAISHDGKIDIVCTTDKKEVVTLKVIDNGVGMDFPTVEKVFDPFFTTKVKGTGLGMMISEKIITEHGGNIFVESEKGKGTTVTIEIPYKTDY